MNDKIKIRPYPNPNSELLSKTVRWDAPLLAFDYTDEKGAAFKTIDGKTKIEEKIFPYIPSESIKKLIKIAQILRRPIFIKGEPGCGKTQLAKAVAYDWYGEDFRKHFFEWHIKSTTKATQGLYHFDHLQRLRNTNFLLKLEKVEVENMEKKEELKKYRKFGPLAKAFLTSTRESPSIILIDEIDKADIDFPNDLLLELDESRFFIPETGENIVAKAPPIVFITSNDERDMPEAFLRRCLFHYIQFPQQDQLEKIIAAHLPALQESYTDDIDKVIEQFTKLRERIEKDIADRKQVSTSELLDWLKVYESLIDEEDHKPDLNNYYQILLKTKEGLRREKKLQENG